MTELSDMKLCGFCESMMASPGNLRRLKEKGVQVCGGSREDNDCLMKAIALSSIDHFNQDRVTDSGIAPRFPPTQYDAAQGTLALFAHTDGSKTPWYDVYTIEIRYYGQKSSNVFNPLMNFDIYALSGVSPSTLCSRRR